jgi:glycosyltransferase involved in cell wall biosynthesis
MRLVLVIAAVVCLLPGAMTAVHLTVLVVAGLFYREPFGRSDRAYRLLILIPARNEERLIGNALDSITSQTSEDDILLVVADRCSDRTAAISQARGAMVLERGESNRPGRAAAVKDGLAAAASSVWDAVVFVDADCTIEPGFLDACKRIVASGAPVAQARTEAERGSSLMTQATIAASALRGIALPRGRDRLRTWVRLNGAGMILRRDVAERYQFGATGASEDGQYSLDLCLAGIAARHVDSARLRYASAASVDVASDQRLRWEAGRLYTARHYLVPLLRARTRPSIEAAIHLASPPLSIAVLLLTLAALLGGLGGWTAGVVIAFVLLVLLAIDVVIALTEAKAGPRVWFALLLAPGYVVWKAWIQLKALVTMSRADQPYEPTPRA